MIYDVDYFIRKFEAIKDEDWKSNATGCAYTICGQYGSGYKDECPALSNLFKLLHPLSKIQMERDINEESYHGFSFLVCCINDNGTSNDTPYKQPTPKARILAALYDIRDKINAERKDEEPIRQESAPKTINVYHPSVLVDKEIVEESKELILS